MLLFCIIIIHVPRENIESAHSDEVALLRSQYSEEDKEIIQKFLQAKRTLRPEEMVQQLHNRMVQEETDQDNPSGKMIVIMLYNWMQHTILKC